MAVSVFASILQGWAAISFKGDRHTGFGDFELPSSLSRSDSLYIYNLYFVLRDFVTKHPKIPESHIVAVFHVPRGHGQDPPFLRFLLFSWRVMNSPSSFWNNFGIPPKYSKSPWWIAVWNISPFLGFFLCHFFRSIGSPRCVVRWLPFGLTTVPSFSPGCLVFASADKKGGSF